MSTFTNRWRCPGFMHAPRKPHPMGNEHHAVASGVSGVLWAMEIVEGKDRLVQLGIGNFKNIEKQVHYYFGYVNQCLALERQLF